MIARLGLVMGAAAALAGCAELIGIHEIGGDAGAGDAGDASSDVSPDAPASCVRTPVLSTPVSPDSVAFSSGFVFLVGGGQVSRCDATAACIDPTPTVQNADLAGATVGASLAYTLQNTGSGGSVHTAALDGTNDTVLLSVPTASPEAVAMGGGRTYWVDANTGDVHCIGCVGADATWISALTAPTALLADGNSVYALALDSSGATRGVYGCGAQLACATAPRVVTEHLDSATTVNGVATDGTYVYVARLTEKEIVGIDGLGNSTTLATGVVATAIAVDPTSKELFYGTLDGEIGRVTLDASHTRTVISQCSAEIWSIAIDATHVYALEPASTNVEWIAYASPR